MAEQFGFMGQRIQALDADSARAYVAARGIIDQIVGVLAAQATTSSEDVARELRAQQLRYSRELQDLGMPGGTPVERVLSEYPARLSALRGGQ